MKYITLLFGTLCCLFSAHAQSWTWLNSSTSQGGNMIDQGIHADNQGNVFNIGLQYQSATFGAITLNNSQVYFCLFLSKQDPNGNYVFAKKIWSDGGIATAVLQLDPSGNVYIFGTCYGYTLHVSPTDSISFSTTLSATDQTKFFLVKYNNNGDLIWTKTGESDLMYANARATTQMGNYLYFGGDYDGDFDFVGINQSALQSNRSFILKVDTSGNGIWLNTSENSQNGMTFMTALANDGTNLYACGKFQNGIKFDNVSLMNNITSVGGERIYLFKFDANGQAVWASQEGEQANYITTAASGNNPNCLAYDGNGNIYMGGSYQDVAGTIQNQIQKPFISKYNTSNGNKLWTVNYDSDIKDAVNGIAIDSNENPIVVGSYIGSMSIDTFSLLTSTYTSQGMLLNLNKNTGSALSAETIGGQFTKLNIGNIFMPADKSYFVMSGFYETTLSLGNDTIYTNGHSVYTAKYSVGNSTSIKSPKIPLAYNLFPNPSSRKINFILNSVEQGTVSIVNNIGQTLYFQHFQSSKGSINISNLRSGQYYLILNTQKGSGVKAFVKF